MRLELELQYADFHPDQIEKIGQVELDQALKVIQSYPWDREFKKIEERTKEHLTSTVPNVTLKNKEKEILIVSARDKENFIIEFLTPTHRAELMLPENFFDNKHGFTTSDIISKFYDGTIRNIIELKPIDKIERDNTADFKLREWPVFTFGLGFVLFAFVLGVDFWSNGFTAKALPAIYFVGVFVLFFGLSSIVTLQYILTDWGKEVSFGQKGELTIRQKGKEMQLKKSEIDHVVIVENENHRILKHYKYARIRTKDERSFIVTSFIMEPIDLINKLNVNHKEESVFIPTINYGILSEKKKDKIKRAKEKKKNEFIENFKNYDDSKLRQIVSDRKNYADYAVEAASEILERRKKLQG